VVPAQLTATESDLLNRLAELSTFDPRAARLSQAARLRPERRRPGSDDRPLR
jgi:hypothetical protein